MSASFQFKQFIIQQDLCAMKVGTDGVLLGAWVRKKEGNLLDIGSGTGVITIMMAQRHPNTFIDAIDIDKNAYLQTLENVKQSKWENKIKVFHTALQKFNPPLKYDNIITNPPYFNNSTKAPKDARNIARHTDSLSYLELIAATKRLLKTNGTFSIILPTQEALLFKKEAQKHQLYLNRECLVKPKPSKAVKRILMEFSFCEKKLQIEELAIETEKRHRYTKEYINLTQDFYLNFNK